MKIKRKLVLLICSTLLLCAMLPSSIYARTLPFSQPPIQNSINEIIVETDSTSSIKLTSRQNIAFEDDYFIYDNNLSTQDSQDLYLFTADQYSTMALKISSSNPDVFAQLYQYNSADGNYYPTNIYDFASGNGAVASLPANNYLLAVQSNNGNVLDGDYTLMYNQLNPGGATAIVSLNENLSQVVLAYSATDSIYANGVDWTSDLRWEEHWEIHFGGGYNARDQVIMLTEYSNIYKGTYTKDSVSYPNVLYVKLDVGTYWTARKTEYRNVNGNVSHILDNYDGLGRKTARDLDEIDMLNSDNYLIIDIDSSRVIEFYSPLNLLWNGSSMAGSSATISSVDLIN